MVTKHTSADLKAKYYIVESPKDPITWTDIPQTDHLPKPVEPRVPKVPIEAPTDDVLDDVDIDPSELDPNETVGPPKFKETVDEREIFIPVENPPQPIGGLAAIQKLVDYPEMAKRAGVEGIVTVVAFVDENGNVVKTEILKSIGAGCDEAAQYAVANTKFMPGKQRDKAVKARVAIPVRFRLTK
ncbi:MAG: energy transducer TonB [Ignavibacteriae bacterium]|nr:energy transducer TonB [Ignavibacteriota bacterium]